MDGAFGAGLSHRLLSGISGNSRNGENEGGRRASEIMANCVIDLRYNL
jgi:hypothetical protein